MADIFKKEIRDYEEESIDSAKNMDVKISDMIMRELLPNDIIEKMI